MTPKKEKFVPDGEPEFSSPGGHDLYRLTMEIWAMQKSQGKEIRILEVLLLGIAVAGIARVTGAL